MKVHTKMVKKMEVGLIGTKFSVRILLKVRDIINLEIESDYGHIGIPMVKRVKLEIFNRKNELENGLIIMKMAR